MRAALHPFPTALLLALAAGTDARPVEVSGIHPHLAMFNSEAECGTGAVVPWADRLWVVTYAPHKPAGSSDKLYEITPDLRQVARPESVGGTPANRMIHRESGQLFIGPHAIDSRRNVRTIPCSKMFGRHTGIARHLTDPANKVVFATMEEGFYEVDVKTLEPVELWADEQLETGRKANLPGYHGKGIYSGQGRYVYANNGDHAREALTNPAVPSGALAEWDGHSPKWNVVRRNQFTEVTGPGGIDGGKPDDPLWSVGWDHRSLILMLLDQGTWHGFRLPKASHCYDGAHGWNTEWPRIRDIGEDALLMTMHGCFWKFPKPFSASNTAGLLPRSTYLKVVGDFCRWGGQIVLGCDDTAKSEFLNKEPLKGNLAGPGESQSNLWFLEPAQLDSFGPPLGRGAVWLDDPVNAGVPSEPYLLDGFRHKSLHIASQGPVNKDKPPCVTLEVDQHGDSRWQKTREVPLAAPSVWLDLSDLRGVWIRLRPDTGLHSVSAVFHYRGDDPRTATAGTAAAGLAKPGQLVLTGGWLQTRGGGLRTLGILARGPEGTRGAYELDATLALRPANDPKLAESLAGQAAVSAPGITADEASVLYVEPNGRRWRLPKGSAAFDSPGPLGNARVCREVCTERNLLNTHGIFYELPARNAGGFPKLRPITTHNLLIDDFASYRGLLVMSGIADDVAGPRVIRSDDGKCAVWVGAVDDLWQFGKPRGTGGPWRNSTVKAGVPSDPCLATGFDRKRLTLSHASKHGVSIRVEADFAGTGSWSLVTTLDVPPGQALAHEFPTAFGAYWLRLIPESDTVATAVLEYD